MLMSNLANADVPEKSKCSCFLSTHYTGDRISNHREEQQALLVVRIHINHFYYHLIQQLFLY